MSIYSSAANLVLFKLLSTAALPDTIELSVRWRLPPAPPRTFAVPLPSLSHRQEVKQINDHLLDLGQNCSRSDSKAAAFKTVAFSSAGCKGSCRVVQVRGQRWIVSSRPPLPALKTQQRLRFNEPHARLHRRWQMHLVSHNSNFSKNKSIFRPSVVTAMDGDVWWVGGIFEEGKKKKKSPDYSDNWKYCALRCWVIQLRRWEGADCLLQSTTSNMWKLSWYHMNSCCSEKQTFYSKRRTLSIEHANSFIDSG